MDWSEKYPAFVAEEQEDTAQMETTAEQEGQVARPGTNLKPKRLSKQVEVADIGCGFGGLLMALAPVMPDTLCLGKLPLSALNGDWF